MLIKLFGTQLVVGNTPKNRNLPVSARTKSDNRRKSLFARMLLRHFANRGMANEDITLYGDGTQTRSFCYVDDLVDGMVRMMENEENFTGPVNLGNPEEITILQLAEIILELTGSKSKIVYRPLPQDDPTQRRPDISLAREKLAWEPKTELRDGLTKTIEYFRNLDMTNYHHHHQ